MKRKGVWGNFFLSVLFPIIGGIINYFIKRKTDKALAIICLVTSIFHPLLIGLTLSILLGFYGWLLYIIIFLIINWLLITNIFKTNPYKYFLPTVYFGIIGLVYSLLKYKGNYHLQKNVILFAIALVVLAIIAPTVVNMYIFYYILR